MKITESKLKDILADVAHRFSTSNAKKLVLIYSGGLDSTVALYYFRSVGIEVVPIGINYGQRHVRELLSARSICGRLGLEYRVVDLSSLKDFFKGSSQTDDNVPVPHGHYAAENMKATIVPNRNMIMLSVAAGIALAEGCDGVAYAAHSGDHAIYPDCRPEFAHAMEVAFSLADWKKLSLVRPFINITKHAIVQLGDSLGVPFADTWSCYEGDDYHCGQCGTCVERMESFHVTGVPDPTTYRIA